MEAISIPTEKYQELINKLDKLSVQVKREQIANYLPERWLDNDEAIIALKVSSRTLQTYRDTGVLAFSQIGSKIYYRAADIQKFFERHYKPAFKK